MKKSALILLASIFIALSCALPEQDDIDRRLTNYTEVTLTADISHLSENQKEKIRLLIEAGKIMDEIFWIQAYGDKESLMARLPDDRYREYARINYGPWDRMDGNNPFVDGYGPKPLGANFYPADMTREEFEAWPDPMKTSLYTLIRRDNDGNLISIPYSSAFQEQHQRAAELMRQAAALAEDEGFRRYMELRADALLTDAYFESDMAWMDMRDNLIEVVIGPIENYEDRMFGYKAAHEIFILIKDLDWSERLAKYAEFLPSLQLGLPVPDEYKAETPGAEADLQAYDAIYYAGDSNAGGKTIAINLPNDERVQLEKGTRRLQLRNSMQAKFDEILLLIAEELIDESQRGLIAFDAFFNNVMFHEVAHGLGIKNTITGLGTVREALRDVNAALEEAKADILGLYMITELHDRGDIDVDLESQYVTFMASIFRSVRFGASSAHGRANMICFNHFREYGAFTRDEQTGTYRVNFDEMREAMTSLAAKILVLQGDGNYNAAWNFLNNNGVVSPELQADLDRLAEKGIPIDITFRQGVEVLGL